jgi:hypothetical protein
MPQEAMGQYLLMAYLIETKICIDLCLFSALGV